MIENLIERFYEAASMYRWNDHIKPVELTELDKQAHKMVIAYVIAKFEEKDRAVEINWQKIIEGEYLNSFTEPINRYKTSSFS